MQEQRTTPRATVQVQGADVLGSYTITRVADAKLPVTERPKVKPRRRSTRRMGAQFTKGWPRR